MWTPRGWQRLVVVAGAVQADRLRYVAPAPELEDRMVDWELPRSASSVHLLTQLGAERQLTEAECVAGTGLAPGTLLDATVEVTARQELRVIRNLLAHCGDEPGLGVQAGSRYHTAMYGVWGLALISSRTLRDAVEVALRYVDLAFAFVRLSFEEAGDEARILVHDNGIPEDVRGFLVERITAGIYTLGQDMFAAGIPAREVWFRHPVPSDTAPHRELFGVEPSFGAEANLFAFDRAYLDLPLPQANDWARHSCERMCQDLVSRRRARTGIAGAVRDLLARHPGSVPDQTSVAAELNLSARTLSRRLADEGTSFRELTDEVREAIAEELLCGAAMTTEQVASRLGYADPASFVRAFKRWKGQSPREFRSHVTRRSAPA